MDDLLEAAAITGYKAILACLGKVYADLRIDTFERLENLPTLRNGKTVICGGFDVYKLIADTKEGLNIILNNSQTIEDIALSFDEEE